MLDAGAVARSLNDHTRILAGIEAHDPDAAQKAMGEHLDRIHRTTIAVMETTGTAPSGAAAGLAPAPQAG